MPVLLKYACVYVSSSVACISWQQEERELASVSQLVEVARAERELGNDFFHQNMFGKALRKYEKVSMHVLYRGRYKISECKAKSTF